MLWLSPCCVAVLLSACGEVASDDVLRVADCPGRSPLFPHFVGLLFFLFTPCSPSFQTSPTHKQATRPEIAISAPPRGHTTNASWLLSPFVVTGHTLPRLPSRFPGIHSPHSTTTGPGPSPSDIAGQLGAAQTGIRLRGWASFVVGHDATSGMRRLKVRVRRRFCWSLVLCFSLPLRVFIFQILPVHRTAAALGPGTTATQSTPTAVIARQGCSQKGTVNIKEIKCRPLVGGAGKWEKGGKRRPGARPACALPPQHRANDKGRPADQTRKLE